MSDRDFLAWWDAPIGPNTKMTNGEAACGVKQACLDTWLAAIASERERHRLEVHSCGPTCTMAGCVNAMLRADFARECSDTDEMLRRPRQRNRQTAEHLAWCLTEIERLRTMLDSRPAINAGLPETYVIWSQGIYAADIAKAVGYAA